MTMYLLDTDILTLAHIGDPGIAERIRQIGEEHIATTVITEIEILRGRYEFLLKASDAKQLMKAQQLLDKSKELLADLIVYSFDTDAAATFDQLRQNKKLKRIGRADLLIASIALARNANFVTRNIKDFQRIPKLNVENWVN